MDFSNSDHTKLVWEQIGQNWGDSQKAEGERFLGNNKLARRSVDDILSALSEDLASIGSLSIDKLNTKWGDRQNRNWVKIITFVLSEYVYYNDLEDGFWQSISQRLKISDTQNVRKTFLIVLKEGFSLLGLAKAKGGTKYLATLYLQSGIPQKTLKHFGELVEDIAENLGWWNIAHRYTAEDLAQTLYDRAEETHRARMTLRRFLKISYQDDSSDQSYIEPLSGNILKYIATVALEIERREINPKDISDSQKREKHLQGFSLPYNLFLRDWDHLVTVLAPKVGLPTKAKKFLRQRKREMGLCLDTLELNLKLVLPKQNLWRKEWKNLSGSYCQIPEQNWTGIIPYPDSLEVPEICTNLSELRDRWTWQLKDANNQDLLEWLCEGVSDNLPLLVFDVETGDRLALNADNLQIIGISELVCYFPKAANLQVSNEIEITEAHFPCLITGWQAQQMRLIERSATFSLVSDSLNIALDWQSASRKQPILRGLQLKSNQLTYLEAPQIYYPLGNSIESIHLQIEDMDRQLTVTPPDTKITVHVTAENWQQIALNQWIQANGSYEVRLWQGNWNWSTSFRIKKNYQAVANPYLLQVQIQNAQQQNVFSTLPIKCSQKSQFWLEEINIQGLWSFEPITFVLSSNEGNHTFSHSIQADHMGSLHLALESLREALPDSDRYFLDWFRLGNCQRLIEMLSK